MFCLFKNKKGKRICLLLHISYAFCSFLFCFVRHLICHTLWTVFIHLKTKLLLTQNNWKIELDLFLFFYPGCTPTLVLWLLPIQGPYALWHWDRLHPPPTLIRISSRRWIILGSFVSLSNLSISSSHKPSLWSSHWWWCHYSFATAAWGNAVFSAVSQKLSIIGKCLLTRQWNVFSLANHVTKIRAETKMTPNRGASRWLWRHYCQMSIKQALSYMCW